MMAEIKIGKQMFFVNSDFNLVKGEITSKGTKNSKLLEIKDGKRINWTVSNSFLGDTEEEAQSINEEHRMAQALRRQLVNERRAEASQLYIRPNTMIYIKNGVGEELVQVLDTLNTNLQIVKKDNSKWRVPKTNFLRYAEDVPLFQKPQFHDVIPGDTVEFIDRGKKVQAKVTKVNPKKFVIEIDGIPYAIAKTLCAKVG